MFDLTDKVALITGGSSGLGREMAKALSQQGAQIAIIDRDSIQGKKVAKSLQTTAHHYKVDVSSEEQIVEAIKTIKQDFGKIDILINNAGVFFTSPLTETTKDRWEHLMSINVTGYYLMAKHVFPLMKKGSKIINISSVAGHHAFPNTPAYSSSKGAILQLTKSMAIEFAEKCNVNAICPGIFVTKMTKDLLQNDSMKQKIQDSVLLKRTGKPRDLSGLAVYLSSDESNYMTGSVLTIDGGWSCHL